MTTWQKPSFEDLAMNAEIGGYQADDGGGDSQDPAFVERTREESRAGSQVAYLVAAFLDGHTGNDFTAQHG